MKRQVILNKIYGKLKPIKRLESIIVNGKKKYSFYECICCCGNIVNVKGPDLLRERVRSCGCLRLRLSIGQKFGKLTTISYEKNSLWNCLCDCGNYKKIESYKLATGHTKSCGCIQKEVSKKNIQYALKYFKSIKIDPYLVSAKNIWKRSYNDGYKNPLISFDNFFKLSQDNCYYCGIEPSNKCNVYKNTGRNKEHIKDGLFTYNGLDRVDNNLPHTKENCVTCCIICNRAKSNKTQQYFFEYIKKLNPLIDINYKIDLEIFINECKQAIVSAKSAWNSNYRDDGLTFEQFYFLSKLPCAYCGVIETNCLNACSNKRNLPIEKKSKYNYKYNGLDRIDNNKGHILNNLVPCCHQCNFAKGKLSLEEFNSWIIRIKAHNEI